MVEVAETEQRVVEYGGAATRRSCTERLSVKTFSEAEHIRCVGALQALLAHCDPGTSSFRIAERALDLCCNFPDRRRSPTYWLGEAVDTLHRQARARLVAGLGASQVRTTVRSASSHPIERLARPSFATRHASAYSGGSGHDIVR